MKRFFLSCVLLLWTVSGTGLAEGTLVLDLEHSIHDTRELTFIPHTGAADSFDNALALNVDSSQLPRLRRAITSRIGRPLKFFTGWDLKGEAHVTTITPPEYRDVLRPYVSMTEINAVARQLDIQDADLRVLGLGSGARIIEGQREETFFLVVESAKLREIRRMIHALFVRRGGQTEDFDPERFFPHLTIGYTHSDIHESHGLIKDLEHSRDSRFSLRHHRSKN